MAEQNSDIAIAEGINDRIMMFIEAEGFKLSEFADKLGIPRSRMTHIKKKRNKPNIEFIIKLLETFPNLNPEWLLLGVGSMYKKPVHKTQPAEPQPANQSNLFQQPNPDLQTTTSQPQTNLNQQQTQQNIVNPVSSVNQQATCQPAASQNTQQQSTSVNQPQPNQNLNQTQTQPGSTNPQMQTSQPTNQQQHEPQSANQTIGSPQQTPQTTNNQGINQPAAIISGPDGTPQQILILFPDRTFVAYKPRDDN